MKVKNRGVFIIFSCQLFLTWFRVTFFANCKAITLPIVKIFQRSFHGFFLFVF